MYQAGELEDGGSDLALKGSIPYYAVEVVYVTALLQVLSASISDKVWWLLLAVRGTASQLCSKHTAAASSIMANASLVDSCWCVCSYQYTDCSCCGSMSCSHGSLPKSLRYNLVPCMMMPLQQLQPSANHFCTQRLGMQEANETDAMRKKREKQERKQNKVKYGKGRR